MDNLKSLIRDVPDFPKPGIVFKDITPLLLDAEGFKKSIEIFANKFSSQKIDKIVGIESRGFIFGTALGLHMGVGFVPVRKAGKLPWTKVSEEYTLEYGTDRIEMHVDAINEGDQVLVIDDLLATGGTAAAVCRLIENQKAKVASLGFVVELDFLNGREKLEGHEIFSILHY